MSIQWYRIGEQLKEHGHSQSELDEHLNLARKTMAGLKKVVRFMWRRTEVYGWQMTVYTGKVEIDIRTTPQSPRETIVLTPHLLKRPASIKVLVLHRPTGVLNHPELKGFSTPYYTEEAKYWLLSMRGL